MSNLIQVRRSKASDKEKDERKHSRRYSSRVDDEKEAVIPEEGDYKIHSERSRRRASDRGVPTLSVNSGDLKATFENILASISREESDALSKSSVVGLVQSLYEWMVFDPDLQVVLPTPIGSGVVKKIWPQGSVIDTRKSKERRDVKQSSRSLKDVSEEYESTVASSVISSAVDEEGNKIGKGSVISDGAIHSATANSFSQPYATDYSQFPQKLFSGRSAQAYSARNAGNHFDVTRYSRAYHPSHDETSQPARVTGRIVPRYSIIGPTPPERVPETPEPSLAGVVQKPKNKVKKPKVGTVTKNAVVNENDGGEEVAWAD